MNFVSARCTNPGPLAKTIPTISFAASLLARISLLRLRW